MRQLLCAMMLAAIPAGSTFGSVIDVYTSRTAWEAAAGTVYIESFDNLPEGFLYPGTTQLEFVSFYLDAGPSDNGPKIAGTGTYIINGTPFLSGHVFTPGQGGGGTTTPTVHTFTFPTPVTAWGADFEDTLTGDNLRFDFGDQSIAMSAYLRGSGTGFIGIVSDTPFTELTIRTDDASSSNAEYFGMDDLSFNAIPEPATLGMLAFGAAALLPRRRK